MDHNIVVQSRLAQEAKEQAAEVLNSLSRIEAKLDELFQRLVALESKKGRKADE
jgi:hypothetical protein